jgi:hypothetical protein
MLAPQRDQPLHPPQVRGRVLLLRLDVDRGVVELGIDHHRREQPVRVGAREPGVAIARPLHRRAHAVAIAEVDVVAHAQLVAVVQDRAPRQREQQRVGQLELAPRAHQRRQPTPDPQVEPGGRVGGVGAVHLIALLLGHHLERQLVVVAQERRPLRAGRQRRRLAHHVDDREAVLLVQREEQPRHQREVEVHVALVAGAEVRGGVGRPLVGLGQEHPIGVARVDVGPQRAQERVGLGQVLAGGAVALVQVGDGVEPDPVDAAAEPEVERGEHRRVHRRLVEVEIGLVGVEAVPVVRLRHRIPGPVAGLEVLEDDPGVGVAVGAVAPHVARPGGAAGRRAPRGLEPRVVDRGVVDDQLGDHLEVAAVGLGQQALEVGQRAVVGVDRGVVGDVVAAVAHRRWIERQQPQRGDAEILQVVEPVDQPGQVADAVAVAVAEAAQVQLVDHRLLEPARGRWHAHPDIV